MAPVCAPTLEKPSPLAPIHLFAKQIVRTFIVSRIIDPKLVQIIFTCFSHVPYKALPSINNIFMCTLFFFFLSFSFSLHTFCGLGEPRRFSLFVHSFVCQMTHSFLTDFSQTCVSTSPMYALPVIVI